MQIQALIGQQNNNDSQIVNARAGKQGEQMVSNLHALYYEQVYRRNVFSASAQAVLTTSVGLATAYTGLVVSNPVGSAINMVLNKVSIMQSVIQATQVEAYALAVGFNATTNVTHTTPLATRSNLIGSGASSVGLADVSATLPTAPFYHTFLSDTSGATQDANGGVVDLDGSVILMPGAYALIVTPAQASVAGLWFGMSWEEVPV